MGVLLVALLAAAGAAPPPDVQVLERTELPGGLVREKLRLPGFDPDEGVPAIAIHPAAKGAHPMALCFHSS